ncbi:hypothetical protein PGT21_004666 [Puccinia graminis f. sp. tritici]|uniref:Uncharacterized protein n=1 Tax=Puccinia graminis f. sp. tritici TaxID=56615 RepID=A0A5B0MU28_PUCGR|nr:hypothetical protein PGT21_000794 [Puccinia graminis f. sp. tritici]KAA1080377.1 hypothetical protein PGT21_004666 [Puccinia graminis f. sp. tritici]KAA1120407.1 hypothetical protein PGTUg99_012655 [Puccinia graminis f. sp. tritici]
MEERLNERSALMEDGRRRFVEPLLHRLGPFVDVGQYRLMIQLAFFIGVLVPTILYRSLFFSSIFNS